MRTSEVIEDGESFSKPYRMTSSTRLPLADVDRSQAAQQKRFLKRLDNPDENWKLRSAVQRSEIIRRSAQPNQRSWLRRK